LGGYTRAESPARRRLHTSTNLDVKRLRAQVLGRIEELEARERERKEMLAELVPAMEERGYDTGDLKAMMR
jgi:hypothetical protein